MRSTSAAAAAVGRAISVVAVAALAGALAQAAHVPGAWLIGPMVVGIAFGVLGWWCPRLPRPATLCAQGVVGTLVAGAFDPSTLPKIAANWPAVLLSVGGTLAASAAVGIVLARVTTLHRATATLGTLPGGAPAMIALSAALGADPRAVALMQYARVIMTVLSASLVGRVAIAAQGAPAGAAPLPAVAAVVGSSPGAVATPATYLLTVLLAGLGVGGGALLRLPAGVILGPMVLVVGAVQVGLPRPAWPPGVPEAAYVLLGLSVGLMFDRVALRGARAQVPAMIGSIVALIVLCAGLGVLLSLLTGSSLLTGYLATAPGGLDSVAIVALASGADVSLMLAVQMVRLFAVILLGPTLARWLLADARPPGPA